VGCGLDETKKTEVTRNRVPKSKREEHAGAELLFMVKVARFEDVGEGKGGEVFGEKDVDNMIGSGADILAGAFS